MKGLLADDPVIRFGSVWASLMFLTAALNLVIALVFPASWPAVSGVLPAISKLGLFVVQRVVARVKAVLQPVLLSQR
jgi:intracellular septation protein